MFASSVPRGVAVESWTWILVSLRGSSYTRSQRGNRHKLVVFDWQCCVEFCPISNFSFKVVSLCFWQMTQSGVILFWSSNQGNPVWKWCHFFWLRLFLNDWGGAILFNQPIREILFESGVTSFDSDCSLMTEVEPFFFNQPIRKILFRVVWFLQFRLFLDDWGGVILFLSANQGISLVSKVVLLLKEIVSPPPSMMSW